MRKVQAVAPVVRQPVQETPIRAPQLRSDVMTPVASALVSGLLVGTTASLSVVAGVVLCGGPIVAWLPGIGVGWALTTCGVATVDWFTQRTRVQATVWALERSLGRDLDGDGVQGKPAPAPKAGWMAVNAPAARASVEDQQAEAERRTRLAALLAFVRRCVEIGTSEGAHGLTPTTRPEFVEMRDLLVEIGVARWKGKLPQAGWELAVSPAQAVSMVKKHVVAK